MGLHVYGDFDSPIIPIVMYQPAKIAAFSRECLDRGLAVVVVGFPATSPLYTRARVCISAAHTEEVSLMGYYTTLYTLYPTVHDSDIDSGSDSGT